MDSAHTWATLAGAVEENWELLAAQVCVPLSDPFAGSRHLARRPLAQVWAITQAKLYGVSVLDFICCARVCAELRRSASYKMHFLRCLIVTFVTHFGAWS